MEREMFEKIMGRTWDTMPERFKHQVKNVALLLEDEPSDEIRQLQHLRPDQTLLGLYRGVPANKRGELYGIGATVPDTITLYRLPILREAQHLMEAQPERFSEYAAAVEEAVRQTLWHEVGHYFGLSEHDIDDREQEGTNAFEA